jgi:hypothetical protein
MEPMQAKQMTTEQADGADSHTPGEFSMAVRIGCKPLSSRSYMQLNKTASSFVKGLVVPAIPFKRLQKRHNLYSAPNSGLPTLHCHPRLSDSQHFGPFRLPCFPSCRRLAPVVWGSSTDRH